MAYTTDQKVSDFTKGEVDVADVKAEWIVWAQNFIDRRTGLNFENANAQTDVLDGDDTEVIFTKRFPIQAVTSLKVDDIAVAAIDFVFDKDTGRIRLRNDVFLRDLANVEIKYTFGFATIPGAVEAAATELVARIALGAAAGQLVDQCKIGDFSAVVKGDRLNKMLSSVLDEVGVRAEFRFA